VGELDRRALDRLDAFVGDWRVEASFPSLPPLEGFIPAHFEWLLERQFLLETSVAAQPVPNSYRLIGYDAARDAYTQHYFDSRGVARVYEMTFDGRLWTLSRDKPDFTSLEFAQHFTGTFEDGGSVIRGRWEIRHPDKDWELDFDLTYTRDA
jgi:hypothetical protein